jgi:hypothetical protein
MGDVVKVGDGLLLDYNDFGAWAGVVIPIVGRDPAAQWVLSGQDFNKTISMHLFNVSGDTLQLLTGTATAQPLPAANGFPLLNNTGITFDLSENASETIYVVGFVGVTNISIGFAKLTAT